MLIEKQKIIEIIRRKQDFYIQLSKKDKSKKKQVEAILTATTLIICEIEKLGESSFEALCNLEGIDKIKE